MTDFGSIPAVPVNAPVLEKQAPSELSPLERMKQESKRTLERFVSYPVTGRPGVVLEFSTIVEPEDLKRYQKNAQGNKKRPEDADNVLAAAQVLQEASRAIYINGDKIVGDDGNDWTLGHKEFIATYGDMGAPEAIKLLLGGGQLLTMSGALVEEAGYGADIDTVDPTKP